MTGRRLRPGAGPISGGGDGNGRLYSNAASRRAELFIDCQQVVSVACPKEGSIYTGIVNLSSYGTGDSHFYAVVANAGNVQKIAAATGFPVAMVRNCLSSPLSVLAQWAGNMMAGGGTIQLDKESERLLLQMAREQMERQNVVIGTGDLTMGRDQVELSRPERIVSSRASMFSFLARTMYFHALSGSVLHMQYVSAMSDIYWAWIGAGGKGFNSRELNNLTAIDLNLGMWPDMAKSIMKFYDNPDVIETVRHGGCGRLPEADQPSGYRVEGRAWDHPRHHPAGPGFDGLRSAVQGDHGEWSAPGAGGRVIRRGAAHGLWVPPPP